MQNKAAKSNILFQGQEDENLLFSAHKVSKIFASSIKNEPPLIALDNLSIELKQNEIIALVGPDGAGKTTFLRLIAGLLAPTIGKLSFEGIDYEDKALKLYENISYMPQKFGLYEDLTVQENLDLYADLKGLPQAERESRYNELLEMCAMKPFTKRLAGKLSGGMKQKLGLICTLLSSPKLLLLDEPTVGVDPLSRRELWQIIQHQKKISNMSIILSTSYLDEAEKCDSLLLLYEGKSLAHAKPEEIIEKTQGMAYSVKLKKSTQARKFQSQLLEFDEIIDALPHGNSVRFVHKNFDLTKKDDLSLFFKNLETTQIKSNLEDSFMLLLKDYRKVNTLENNEQIIKKAVVNIASSDEHLNETENNVIIEIKNVSRFFGDFIAVDNISFNVKKGEIFALLGPNGAGKTTTFRMLCGLLPASVGSLFIAGVDVKKVANKARKNFGYVAQKFSLYGTLSAKENLDFFAGIYELKGNYKTTRIEKVIEEFNLQKYLNIPSQTLPGGYKQRLAMAVGLLHEPSILFLDEPTSGADPLARREFWQRITHLSEQGVTIIVTTHFMEEAEYCDRVLIQDHGRMLALGKPEEIKRQEIEEAVQTIQAIQTTQQAITMEEAFIRIIKKSRQETQQT